MIPQQSIGSFPKDAQIGEWEVVHDWAIDWSGQLQPFVNGKIDNPVVYGIGSPSALVWSDENVDVTPHATDPGGGSQQRPRASVIFQSLVDAMRNLPVMPWDQGE